MDSQNKKKLLWFSICNNLIILGFFKYYNFFLDSFIQLSHQFGFDASPHTLKIILPVGISFYTFQTMSYTIDIYREKMKPTESLLDFSLFVSFFPQLVAGPIERASKLLPQIEKLISPTREHLIAGSILIFTGYIRKVLISDNIAPIVDDYFKNYETLSSIYLLAGLILFSFQIYFDFSGYSSIARGLAKILGIDLMINFNQPYFSQNISEFWNRWHISLSSWLRDYVYIPLGGNRSGETRTYINLMITMMVGGLWHGPSWNFVYWGALHGCYLVVYKMMFRPKENEQRRSLLFSVLCAVFIYCLVLITWLPFRAPDIKTTHHFLYNMVMWSGEIDINIIWLLSLLFSVLILIDLPIYITKDHTCIRRLPIWFLGAVLFLGSIAVLITMVLNVNSVRPFIYFQF
ncbi:MBOAT family protein [Candidatus Uabimicrobium sp. HlEnr_7]|uniref:MBOAT family O-acyltransferase n=1 Tax=Candidatus Uabimicrobium helgolandensis TaxID=3095367 RepID=UPI003556F203